MGLVFSISSFFIAKTTLANNWRSFSSSYLALVCCIFASSHAWFVTGRDLAKTHFCATCKKETNDVKPRNVLYGTFLINQSVSVWCSNTGVLHRFQLWFEFQVMPRPSDFFCTIVRWKDKPRWNLTNFIWMNKDF